MAMMRVLFFGIFLFSHVCLRSTPGSSTVLLYLPDQDSQFFGQFERNFANITYDVSSTTTLTESLEQCADYGEPLLFMKNAIVIGCGSLYANSTNFQLNTTDPKNTTGNRSGTACLGNSTTEVLCAYNTEHYSVVVLPVFLAANYTVLSTNNGEGTTDCSFDSGDQSNTATDSETNKQPTEQTNKQFPFFEHHYLSYGNFRASIQCFGNSLALHVSRRIFVGVPPVIGDLHCPTYLSTNDTSACVVDVLQGVGMYASVEIGDDVKVVHELPATMVGNLTAINESVQEVNCHLTENDNKLFILPSMFFERMFYLRAIELVSPASGPVHLHVFRVSNDLSFSTESNDEFCPLNNVQLSNSTATVCFHISTKHYTNPVLITSSAVLTAVHSILLFVESGYNYVMLGVHDVFVVKPGDVIGLTVNQSHASSTAHPAVPNDPPSTTTQPNMTSSVPGDPLTYASTTTDPTMTSSVPVDPLSNTSTTTHSRVTSADPGDPLSTASTTTDPTMTSSLPRDPLTTEATTKRRTRHWHARSNKKSTGSSNDPIITTQNPPGELTTPKPPPTTAIYTPLPITHTPPPTNSSEIPIVSSLPTTKEPVSIINSTENSMPATLSGNSLSTTSVRSLSPTSSAVIQTATSTPSSSICSGMPFVPFHRLSIYGFLPYRTHISLGLTHPGNTCLKINITDRTKSILSFSQIVIIQEPVEGISFPFNKALVINSTQTISFFLARGTRAQCEWSFKKYFGKTLAPQHIFSGVVRDEDGKERPQAQFNYTHDVHGMYVFHVTCSNEVSSISEKEIVTARRNISAFNASLCHETFTYAFTRTCWIAKAFGDYIRYTWIIDGSQFHEPTVTTKFSRHSPPGEQNFANVTADNVISIQHLVVWYKILENPLTIQLNDSELFPSLSVFSFAPKLSWNGTANGTEFYESYGVLISEALREFIAEPLFNVQINDQEIAGNITNFTSVEHVFPRAGQYSVKHSLYVEAVGHSVLNRKAYITIFDIIEGLTIKSPCSSEVVVNESCSFQAWHSRGSDMVFHWRIGEYTTSGYDDAVSYVFRELGNIAVFVNATNAVSDSQAVIHINVRARPMNIVSSSPVPKHGSSTNATTTISQSVEYSSTPLWPYAGTPVPSTSRTSGFFPSSTTPRPPVSPPTLYGPSGIVKVGQVTNFSTSIISTQVIYTWYIANVTQDSNTTTFSVIFHQPGVFLVSLEVSNHITRKRYSLQVTVQSTISGLNIISVPDPYSQHLAVLISVASGTNVTFSVHYGDGSSPSSGIVPELANVSLSHYYHSPGYYNVTVSVFNTVGPNITKSITVLVKKACVVELTSLQGTSPDLQLTQNFAETDIVLFTLRFATNCSTLAKYKFRWQIRDVVSNKHQNVSWSVKTSLTSQTARFPAKNIAVGKYKVIVTMVMPNGTSFYHKGYFGRTSESLAVTCSCGNTRTVALDKPFILNATVFSDTPSSGNLSYEWFCDERLNVTCFGEVIPRNRSVVEFPGNFFSLLETYDFVVRVTNGENMGTCSQQIILGPVGSILGLCVRSLQGPTKTPHYLKTELIATCLDCDKTSTITWFWNLMEVAASNSQPASSFDHLILNDNKLIIPPNTLQPDTLYRITVNASSQSKNGFVVYSITTKHAPFGGTCHVTPTQATTLKTSIVCACQGWRDEFHPLVYEFAYSLDDKTYSLFYYGKKPESPPTYLETGYENRDYTVNVRVIVKDSIGQSIATSLSLKNRPLSDAAFGEMFDPSRDMTEQVDNLLNGTDGQTATQLVKTVSGVLNQRSSDYPEEIEQRRKIREALLRHMATSSFSDSHAIQQILQTLLTLSQVPNELTAQAQIFSAGIYLNISASLNGTTSSSTVNNLLEGMAIVIEASLLLDPQIDINNIRVINQVTLAAIDRLGDYLLRGLEPGEPAIMLYTPLLNIALQKHFTSKITGQQLMVSSHFNEFTVPENIGNLTGSFVGTKLVSIQNNPYIWTPNQTLSPTTTVASLVLQDPYGEEMIIRNLSEPFSMFIYTPNATQVPVNASEKIKEYDADGFYEIHVTRSNSAILVTFDMVTADAKGQLHLRLQNSNRSAVFGNDVIISTELSFPVSVTWAELGPQGIYYLGIQYETFSIGFQEVPHQIQYSISIQEIGCFYWSDAMGQWVSDGCQVGSLSMPVRTHCLCNHLTWFGGSLIVPPNPISLATVADRIQDPTNYVTILAVFCLIFFIYFLAILWARKTDKMDKNKRRITWSPSNAMTDTYHYQVIIYTGIRRNAGTTANVGLMISGESEKSRKCLLKDSKKDVLKRGGIDPFVVTTEDKLGDLEYVHIWHDNTGDDPAWFVNQVVVMDTETEKTWTFLCYRWLAVDEGDGQIQRVIPVADAEELVRFRHLFVSRATIELTDAHLWFSIAFRPVYSPFTRVQRVSCCLSLLLTSMMANAMWYQTGGSASHLIDLGLFTFSWEGIFIGVCSSLIVLPVNVLLVQLFRRRRVKESKNTHLAPSSDVTASPDMTSLSVTSPPMTSSYRSTLSTKSYKTTSSYLTSSTVTLSDVTSSNAIASPDMGLQRRTSKRSLLNIKQEYRLSVEKPLLLDNHGSTSLAITSSTGKHHTEGGTLPHWVVYIAWLCMLVTCLASATVTLFYGVQFGEEKTRRWLLSLSVSIVNDIFVAQPLKVLLVAIILAYVIRKPFKATRYAPDDDVEDGGLEPSEQADDVALEVPDPKLCTAEQFLENAREKRQKDKFMHGLLKTISSYFFFVLLVLIIAYGQRDSDAYHLTEVQQNTFTRPGFVERLDKRAARNFYQVVNISDFWLWSKAVFIPGLSSYTWHNYSGEWSSFSGNFAGYVFGAARWRQKRLKDGVCKVLPIFQNLIPHCTGNYGYSHEDRSDYLTNWNATLLNNASCNPPDLWCFQTSETLKTFAYRGNLKTYAGGGYTVDILPNYELGLNITEDIEVQRWIDKYTRAVFVEFTVYNPNVNLFSVITLLFEVSSSGNFFPRAEILSIRLFNYVGSFQIFVLVCHGFFLLFVCYFTYHTGKMIFHERCAFFRKTWNVYDLMVVLVSWLLVAFFAISTIAREWTLEEFRENPTKFTSFWYSSSWNMSKEYVIAWLVFLVSLKFLRLFQFNQRMFLLPLTLSNTAWDLANYSLVFAVVMLAFTFLYYLVLHTYDFNFAGLVVTIETLLRVLLGKSNVLVQRHQFPVLERLMLFCYVCLMKFLLLNIFVIILNDGFFRARETVNLRRNDFEFVDFVRDMIYDNLGIRRLYGKLKGSQKETRRVRFFEEESSFEYKLEIIEQKLERMTELVDFISTDEDSMDDVI